MQPAFHRAEIARYAGTMRDVAVPRISAWPDGGTLALDREMRSITLTVLVRTLLSSDTGTGMTNNQLRDEATTLVIAGSETTGNTIAWACYLLARHPEVQERLQAEADRVLAGVDADYETLGRLPFTRAVITEALRLYSPVWILPRRALADVELGGYLLPAGSRIFFSPYALNHDPRLHRAPDRFEPAPRFHINASERRGKRNLVPHQAGLPGRSRGRSQPLPGQLPDRSAMRAGPAGPVRLRGRRTGHLSIRPAGGE